MGGTDEILETVLRITGGAQYVAQLAQAAAGTAGLAVAEGAAALAAAALDVALAPLTIVLGLIAAALALLTAGLANAKRGVEAFAAESQQLFHTEIIFRNLGVNLPTDKLVAFSDQLARTTASSRTEIEGAAGVLARTGLGAPQIQSALKTIVDVSKATGDSIEQVTEAVNGGIEGRGRALRKYGFEIEDTGSKLANLQRTQQQLNARFEGAGAAARQTPQGALDALAQSLERFWSTFGSAFGPAVVLLFNTLANAIDWVTDKLGRLLEFLHFLSFGAIGSPSSANPAAKVGHGGDPATEKTQQQIADNTRKVADKVEQAVLGGAGVRAGQAFNWRDLSLGLKI